VEIAGAMMDAQVTGALAPGVQMSLRSSDLRARPRASIAWTRSLAWLLAALLAGPVARAEPQAQGASAESKNPVVNAVALPSLEHPDDPNTYQRVKALAVEEWNAGHWAEARALFLLAHGLRPSARTLRALGKTAFELRLYPEAVRELSAALTDPRQPLDAELSNETRALLDRAEASVGRYRIELDPPDVVMRIDGATPLLEPDGSVMLALGTHQLEIEASGYQSERHTIEVASSDEKTLTFRLSPEAKPVPSQPGGKGKQDEDHYLAFTLSAAGGAVLLGTASLATGLRAFGEDKRVEDTCNGTCDPADDATHKRDALVIASYVTLGAAAAFATGALVLYLIDRKRPRDERPPSAAQARVSLGSDLALHF
jgi:tetratricopeptide (TPR) repeat protein